MIAKIRGVLIDLSGTLHIEDTAIPGSVAALTKLLQQRDVDVRFVTNTTKKSAKDLIQELHGIGFTAINANHVLTTGGLARALLEREKLRPLLMLHPSLLREFEGVDCENPNAVVIGLAPEHFNYDMMNAAFRILINGGKLIALNKAQSFASKAGLNIGPGAFVQALEYAANVPSTIIGNVAPEHAVMIGDDMRQDVGGAMAIGMRAALVRTGRYRPGDEHSTDVVPSYVGADFADAVEWILQQNSAE
uniref:Haloacid dehalogenase-like hydrolase domain-containing protein 2 n=1 Tax=Globisporangium ultimum (strain ATCC 200006 / CBS 805.95 / DAOM BR144) TaxID=431595 RepID=K3WU56_GLOUD